MIPSNSKALLMTRTANDTFNALNWAALGFAVLFMAVAVLLG